MRHVAEMITKKVSHTWPDYRRRIGPYRVSRILAVGCIVALTLPFFGCGGDDSSSSAPPPQQQNPVPSLSTITPARVPEGSKSFTLTVAGYNFLSGSVIRWNSSSRTTTYVSATQLRASISPEDVSSAGTATVTVFNPAPGGGESPSSKIFTIDAVDPLSILATQLPNAHNSKAYNYTLQASGGIQPYTWSIVQGSLPSGLNLSASSGKISGTPPVVANNTDVGFSVQLEDDAYAANTQIQPLNIRVLANKMGRNDTCNSATSISNGVIRASISPYGDVDVYSFQGTAGQRVTAETYANRLEIYDDASSQDDDYMDSFLEVLDSTCNQITYNDDISTRDRIIDSRISNYTLPNTGTYYIRVSDLRGDGRPDLIYELHLTVTN